jgi:hypothetical protein
MKFTLTFGAPVMNNDSQLGKLKRIVVNNGIANQVTVDPGLLSYERVVPISDFVAGPDDTLRVNITDTDWKAYSAFTMDQPLDNPNQDGPDMSVLTTDVTMNQQAADTNHPLSTGTLVERETVDQMSIVLTSATTVVNEAGGGQTHKLHGLVIDTGRPQVLLLDDGTSLPFDAVTMLDEERIHVGGAHQQPVLDADRGYESTTIHDPAGDERR